MANPSEPIKIKKYANRRLYNTGTVQLRDAGGPRRMVRLAAISSSTTPSPAKTSRARSSRRSSSRRRARAAQPAADQLPPAAHRLLRRLHAVAGATLSRSIDRIARQARKISASRSPRPSVSRRSDRSRTRCGGTWRCSSAPSRCLRRSRAEQAEQAAPEPGPGRRRQRPNEAAATRSTISSGKWKRCRNASTGWATRKSSRARYADAAVPRPLIHGLSSDARPISAPCR